MSHRRLDAIYFLVLLGVAWIGYQLASGGSDDSAAPIDDSFFASNESAVSLPEPMVELPEPFWVFRRSPGRVAPESPTSSFADPVETALSRLRKRLLAERTIVETEGVTPIEGPAAPAELRPERLAAAYESNVTEAHPAAYE